LLFYTDQVDLLHRTLLNGKFENSKIHSNGASFSSKDPTLVHGSENTSASNSGEFSTFSSCHSTASQCQSERQRSFSDLDTINSSQKLVLKSKSTKENISFQLPTASTLWGARSRSHSQSHEAATLVLSNLNPASLAARSKFPPRLESLNCDFEVRYFH
jgi:hypothetical protein